jgi:hypothetical protein
MEPHSRLGEAVYRFVVGGKGLHVVTLGKELNALLIDTLRNSPMARVEKLGNLQNLHCAAPAACR